MTSFYMGRRTFLKTGVAAVAATALPRVAFAAPRTVKIGLVAPVTGPLAIFTEQLPWTIDQIKAFTNGQIDVGGTKHPLEIIVRDSQSNPNRAAEVAKGLILQDKVDLVTTFATPETVNPVADQCEVSGVPCLSNDCPLEPYFFGRQGDPKKGFDWTYNYFFSAVNMADAYYDAWDQVPTNKVVGALWPNDNDGNWPSRRSSPAWPPSAATRSSIRAVSTCRPAITAPRSRRSSRPARRSSPACCRRPNSPPS